MSNTDIRFPAHTARKLFINNIEYRNRCIERARMWALANKSDPFAFAKCLNDHRTGIAFAAIDQKDGYKIDWSNEQRTLPTGEHYTVQIPINLARP